MGSRYTKAIQNVGFEVRFKGLGGVSEDGTS